MTATIETPEHRCIECRVPMEQGTLTASGLIGGGDTTGGSRILFVRQRSAQSMNLVKAFVEGMTDSGGKDELRVIPFRCPECQRIEMFSERP